MFFAWTKFEQFKNEMCSSKRTRICPFQQAIAKGRESCCKYTALLFVLFKYTHHLILINFESFPRSHLHLAIFSIFFISENDFHHSLMLCEWMASFQPNGRIDSFGTIFFFFFICNHFLKKSVVGLICKLLILYMRCFLF